MKAGFASLSLLFLLRCVFVFGVFEVGNIYTFTFASFPESIALDSQGNVFYGNGATVEKFIRNTETSSTVAGNGTTLFSTTSFPNGAVPTTVALGTIFCVRFDRKNNVLLADGNNFAIRIINITTGTISTLVSVPNGRSEKDVAGMAVDPFGNIYFARPFMGLVNLQLDLR